VKHEGAPGLGFWLFLAALLAIIGIVALGIVTRLTTEIRP
jgi:hypothetical protein